MALVTISPSTDEIIQEYPEMTPAEVKTAIGKTHEAFQHWRKTSFVERAVLMRRAGQILRERAAEYGRLMALEMGKPVKDGKAEAEKCGWVCDYYADNAEAFLQAEPVATDASKSFITFQPIGIVLAIMPWNFPFWQVWRFAAPSLMAGNVALLKHAPNVMGCAQAIEAVFQEAGFPEHVFTNLVIDVPQVEAIIEDPRVAAVTLTGSTRAGKAVAAKAGAMLKKTVLELGGSDPYVVLEDADLETAVKTCVFSRLINAGQSCIAAKRFIVVEAVRQQFEKLYVEQMQTYQMGDPFSEGVTVGPQARHDLRDNLHRQVQESIANGATCLLGGELPTGPGAFYPLTVLTNVQPGQPAYDEELFGPVAAIITAKDEAEAIRIANDTAYGLGAAIFTQDLEKAEHLATHELHAGCCFVNSFVKSDPRLPFGGIKESGYGRELSMYGIKEFVNIKTIYVK